MGLIAELGKTVDPKKGEGDIRNQVWCFHCAVENGWIDTDYPGNECEKQLGDFPGC